MKNFTKTLSFSKLLIAGAGLLAGILLNITGSAQSTNTNSGTNFWFAFPSNYDGNTTNYVVYINTFQTTNGTISIPGMAWTQTFTAVAGTTTRIVVPSADANITTFTGPVGQAVNVVSDSNVSVFAAIEHSLRTENTIIMPVAQLGNQYYVMDYKLLASNYSENTEFLVVAQGCTDSVEIIPSQNITVSGTHAANVPYTVVLAPGQVYEVICNTGDLTGSMVRSLNHSETGVFAASTFNAVDCSNTGNPFYEEMMPLNNWGNDYVFLPTTQAQDQCRVLAEQNGTIVTFMTTLGNNVQTLNAGQYYDTTVIYSTPVYISSSNPISVERLLRTATCNNYYVTNPGTLGDPSEAMVAPNSQMFSDSTVFYVSLTPDFDSAYVQIVTRTTDVNTVYLDNINIGAFFTTLTPNPLYSYASLPVAVGSHTLTSTGQGFISTICDLGNIDAEATFGGLYQSENPTLSTSSTGASSCNPTGTASVNATGGIPPFAYSWTNGQTTQTATGLSAGSYTVTVSDSESCYQHRVSATVTITAAPALRDSASVSDTLSCKGGGADATVGVMGGTGPYTYLWTPGGNTTASVTGLSAGTYTVAVLDASNCPATPLVITITQPESLDITIASKTTIICEQFGYITAHAATGGTPPYSYLWTPSGGTDIATTTDLTAGTYTITATDSKGCTATASETISYPPKLTISNGAITGTSCYGGDNGSASVSAAGGTPAYTYSWFPDGGTNASASGLSGGTYTVTATDSNGCNATTAVVITEPPGMVITSDSVDVTANCTGQASVSVTSGGTPPYTYMWSPGGETTATISGLCAGDYCCTVTQANGCSQTVCVVVINVTGIPGIDNGDGNISVYPNPNNGEFTIQTPDGSGQLSVEIYNVLGQKIYSELNIQQNDKVDVNLRDKSAGMYFYRILKSDGGILGAGKILVDK